MEEVVAISIVTYRECLSRGQYQRLVLYCANESEGLVLDNMISREAEECPGQF